MARMYPCIREKLSGPEAEKMVYDELKKLPNEYTIFHSVQWVKKNLSRNFTWYENDFLILHKDYGILLLEVKGGHCFFKDGLMHQVNTVTKAEKILDEGNDPLSQAQRGIQHFRRKIEKTALKIEGSICVEPLIWFPSCEFDPESNLPDNYYNVSFAIFDANDLPQISGISLEKRLKSVYEEYGSQHKTVLTDMQFQWIKDLIAPDFNLIPSPSIIKTEIDNEFIRLTNEQSVLLDYIGEQRYAAIQGAAGTGKTMIANMAAERFANEGRKVLFLCYNKFLYQFLSSNKKHKKIDYYNIDSFVVNYCNMETGNAKKRLLAYEEIDIESFPYDDIIIDEAQDFANKEIFFFKHLCELRESHCFIFFDKNQVVLHDNSVSYDEENEPLSWIEQSECRLILSKNCRNTIEIAKTAYSVIDFDMLQKMNDVSGDQPTIVFSNKNSTEKIAETVQYYIDHSYKPDEITILTMCTEASSIIRGAKQLNGIQLKDSPEKTGVLFTTARKYKGLENKVIIIIDIDGTCFSEKETKNNFYVACSRATHALTLMINGDDERIKAIASEIPGSGLSGKGKIILKTKTTPHKY